MKQINTTKGTFLFVEVPDDVENLRCHTNFNQVSYLIGFKAFEVKLPKGKWVRFSTTKDITEEQSESIVEKIIGLGDYKFRLYNERPDVLSNSPNKSLQSLIQANGLDVNKNYLILKLNT